MKNIVNAHPLLGFVPSDDLDVVLAPNMEVVNQTRIGWRVQYEALIRSHLAGVQRMGVVPSVETTRTRYFAIEFSPDRSELRSPMEKAVLVASVLHQEQLGFGKIDVRPEQSVLDTAFYHLPLHLERHASLTNEKYVLWFLFNRAVERSDSWLLLQAMLVSLGIERGVRILPRPHYRAQQSVDDVAWLPLFPGSPQYVNEELFGGTGESRTVFLEMTKTRPVTIESPTVFERIAPKELEKLSPVLAPDMPKAISMLPNPPQPPFSSARSGHYSSIPPDLADPGLPPNYARSVSPSDPHSADELHPQPAMALIIETVRGDLQRQLQMLNGMGIFDWLAEIKKFLKARAVQIPSDLLGMWGHAVADVLGVEAQWVADLMDEALRDRAASSCSLVDLLRRAETLGSSSEQKSVLLIRWLAANGGRFLSTDSGCVLNWEGTEVQVALDSPFATLFWNLSSSGGHPFSLNTVFDNVRNESRRLSEVLSGSLPPVGAESATPSVSSIIQIVNTIEKLFDTAVESPDALQVLFAGTAQIEANAGRVVVGAAGKKMYGVLNFLTGVKVFETVETLRDALRDHADDLGRAGISWEEVPMGRGKPKAFRLTRATGSQGLRDQ